MSTVVSDFNAARGGTPQGCVPDHQVPGEYVRSRLQERVERPPAVGGAGVRRRGLVDSLPCEHVELGERVPEAFQVRQVGVQVERRDPLKQPEPVQPTLGHYRRWRAVGIRRRVQPEPILDRHP